MAGKDLRASVAEEKIPSKIYVFRTEKLMLDNDLAEIYGVEKRVLNQCIKRTLRRFPKDFMFQLSEKEFKNLISQNVISSWEVQENYLLLLQNRE